MTHYDTALSDEEWREANFPEDVLHSAIAMGKVAPVEDLIAHADRFGPDGVLESAIMLGQVGYKRVEDAITPSKPRKRRS